MVGSWWVVEELPKAEDAQRQHEGGEVGGNFVKSILALFLVGAVVQSLLHLSLQKC